MSEKSRLDPSEELLAEYGVTHFELAMNLYFEAKNCDDAKVRWDYDKWPFCPACGSAPNEKGVVLHGYYRQKALLV